MWAEIQAQRASTTSANLGRRRGLGPQGKEAVRRAAREISPLTNPGAIGNPAAITHEEPGDETAELDWVPVNSHLGMGAPEARCYEAAYDPQTKQLHVSFQKRRHGDYYIYEGVEKTEWRAFLRSDSPGRYINTTLNFKDYYKVSAGTD